MRKKILLLCLLVAALAAAGFAALFIGEYPLKPATVAHIVLAHIQSVFSATLNTLPLEQAGVTTMDNAIVWDIRLPRLLLAILAGMALACAGAAYQGVFRNPLVEPYLLGVSAGAAWGASLAIVFPALFPQGQITAFVFALLAVFLSWLFARGGKSQLSTDNGPTLILAGIIVGALFGAMVNLLKYLAADSQMREITFWMLGGFFYATWQDVWINTLATIPCVLFCSFFGWKLNVLSMGEEEAKSLGLATGRTRLFFLLTTTLAAALCVSTVGIIAWVGLMMPHAARLLLGPDNRFIIPGAALLGALYMLFCDTLARSLTGAEIPIGIITSVVGAPYLLWLLHTRGNEIYGS